MYICVHRDLYDETYRSERRRRGERRDGFGGRRSHVYERKFLIKVLSNCGNIRQKMCIYTNKVFLSVCINLALG